MPPKQLQEAHIIIILSIYIIAIGIIGLFQRRRMKNQDQYLLLQQVLYNAALRGP